MDQICSINQAIKHFKGDLKSVRQYFESKGINISDKALKARLKFL